ncbi:MAG TPA: FxDxF family PEP-CTERM protein [Novosphingobium sp.]
MKKFTTAGLAIAMASFASPVQAADIIVPLTCNGAGTVCSGAFNLAGIGAGAFTQGFTFTLPQSGLFSGSVTTEFQDPASDIDFTSIVIDNNALLSYAKNPTVIEPQERWDISNVALALGGHRIDLSGNSGGFGSFAGTISFAAVPEPATWGLMILGFGLVGGALRRRRQKVSVRYA